MRGRFEFVVVVGLLLSTVAALVWGLWWCIFPYVWLLHYCHRLLGDWGQAITLATVVNGVGFALVSRGAQQAKRVRDLRPQIDALGKLYASDRVRKDLEIATLYRRAGINGWTFLRPLLFLPVLFWTGVAMFVALWRLPDLHGVRFLWVPDLSASDPRNFLPLIHGTLVWLRTLVTPRERPKSHLYYLMIGILVGGIDCWLPASWLIFLITSNVLALISQTVRRLLRPQSPRPDQ
jgi:YidC/Oxa1 family membrane protein insertase